MEQRVRSINIETEAKEKYSRERNKERDLESRRERSILHTINCLEHLYRFPNQ